MVNPTFFSQDVMVIFVMSVSNCVLTFPLVLQGTMTTCVLLPTSAPLTRTEGRAARPAD